MGKISEQGRKEILFFLLMGVFGCLGPIVRAINLPTAMIACARAWIAGFTLLIWALCTKAIKSGALCGTFRNMVIAGALLAGDWIGLFLAYNHTTIATATVCYYVAPIMMVIGSVLFLGEKMSLKHFLCIIVSFIGLSLITGFFTSAKSGQEDLLGPLFAIVGAASYTGVVLINKKHSEGNPIVKTMVQFFVAAILTLPYVLFTTDFTVIRVSGSDIMLLLLMGVFVTAIAYVFYFSLITDIPSRSIAICSYADPLVALFISFVFLREPISVAGIIGSILIIGSSLLSELI